MPDPPPSFGGLPRPPPPPPRKPISPRRGALLGMAGKGAPGVAVLDAPVCEGALGAWGEGVVLLAEPGLLQLLRVSGGASRLSRHRTEQSNGAAI